MQLQDVDADNSGEIDIDEFISAMKTKHVDVESEEASTALHSTVAAAIFTVAVRRSCW